MTSLIRLITRTIIRQATYRSMRKVKGIGLVAVVAVAIMFYLMTETKP